MNTIDRAAVGRIDTAVLAALKEVGESLGLDIRLDGGRFGPDRYNMKVAISPLTGSGKATIPLNFIQDARRLQVDPTCWGKSFRYLGEIYKVTGLKVRNRKYPVLATRKRDGQSMKLPKHFLQHAVFEEDS